MSEYDRTKAAAHDIAKKFIQEGLPLVIVQPGLIYGPGDNGPTHDLFVDYLKRRLPMLPRQTAYTWAHVDDVARGHILAMEQGRTGESYFVCGPAHTLIEAMRLAEEISGVPAPAIKAPPWVLKGMSGLTSAVERVAPLPKNYSSEFLREAAGTTYLGSNAKARQELGWEPRLLKEGLPETLQHEMKLLGMRLRVNP